MTGASELKTMILDLLYPPRCPICDGIAPWNEPICPKCREKLPYVPGRRCARCGKPVEPYEMLCDDCRKVPHVYDEGRGVFLYNDVMKQTMIRLKYKQRREYGRVLGGLVYEAEKNAIRRWRPEALIPVPIYKKKLETRGYNQAEEIARPIAERAGVPLLSNLLVRVRQTEAMKSLSATERRNNLTGAFTIGKQPGRPLKSVIVVDDIYTTGATIDACAEVLRRAGTAHVYFLAVCIGQGFMVRY